MTAPREPYVRLSMRRATALAPLEVGARWPRIVRWLRESTFATAVFAVAVTPREEEPQINLTAMIDTFMLLLIFFMLATNFAQIEKDMNVALPPAATETTGNNADAYADLDPPTGFTPSTADMRAATKNASGASSNDNVDHGHGVPSRTTIDGTMSLLNRRSVKVPHEP